MSNLAQNVCDNNTCIPCDAVNIQRLQKKPFLRVSAILVVAALLSVTALDWGLPNDIRPYPYHPDELAGILTIVKLVDAPHHLSTTVFGDTKGYGYFYSAMAATMIDQYLRPAKLTPNDQQELLSTIRRPFLIARITTMLFFLGTVFFTFLAGKSLFGPQVGELAAALVAISPITVINAHYVKADCPEAFWIILTIYLAGRSRENWKWLLGAILTSGVAGGFKYPGASALITVLAAVLFLQPEQRLRRLRIFCSGLPLFVAGFLLTCPAILFVPHDFLNGLRSEFASKMVTGTLVDPLIHMLEYPWYLAKGAGAIIPAWGGIAIFYALFSRRKATSILTLWLIPYGALMAGSSMILTRYAVPQMPVLALLMSILVVETATNNGSKSRKFMIAGVTAAASSLILIVTLIHLSTMMRPDPRDLAEKWIRSHLNPGTSIGVTLSHAGDNHFVAPIDSRLYKVVRLTMAEEDVSGYLELPLDFLVVNERAWIAPGHPSQKEFWRRIMETDEWEISARFSNRPHLPGLLLKGTLPEDMYYLYQEVRIYHRHSAS